VRDGTKTGRRGKEILSKLKGFKFGNRKHGERSQREEGNIIISRCAKERIMLPTRCAIWSTGADSCIPCSPGTYNKDEGNFAAEKPFSFASKISNSSFKFLYLIEREKRNKKLKRHFRGENMQGGYYAG
jgi:hypothetical protein